MVAGLAERGTWRELNESSTPSLNRMNRWKQERRTLGLQHADHELILLEFLPLRFRRKGQRSTGDHPDALPRLPSLHLYPSLHKPRHDPRLQPSNRRGEDRSRERDDVDETLRHVCIPSEPPIIRSIRPFHLPGHSHQWTAKQSLGGSGD